MLTTSAPRNYNCSYFPTRVLDLQIADIAEARWGKLPPPDFASTRLTRTARADTHIEHPKVKVYRFIFKPGLAETLSGLSCSTRDGDATT